METAFLDSLKGASPLVLVLLLVNGVGVVLKAMKRIPFTKVELDNDIIPFVLIPLGAAAAVGLLPDAELPFTCPYPWVCKVVLGVIIGAGSVGAHVALTKFREMTAAPDVRIAQLEAKIAELYKKREVQVEEKKVADAKDKTETAPVVIPPNEPPP